MNKAEEILRTYVDFEDVNGSEPITLLPLTVIDAMEEYATQCQEECNIFCPKCGGDSWKLNGIKTTIKHCKCGNDF